MATDEPDPKLDPSEEEQPEPEAQALEPHRQDEMSWLGCLWIVIVPGIIFAAVVITLNWLGC